MNRPIALTACVLTFFSTQIANAQIVANSLPPGEVAIPAAWTAAAPVTPVPQRWAAYVSWAITTPAASPAGLQTYWYKISHLGPGTILPVQVLKSSTLDLDPALIYNVAGVYQFGQLDAAGNLPGQSWGAEPISMGDTTIRWSWYSGLTGFNRLTSGETVYLWLQSTRPANWVNITLQNGVVAQTQVPAPAPVPEPMTFVLVGSSLCCLAGLRRNKAQ